MIGEGPRVRISAAVESLPSRHRLYTVIAGAGSMCVERLPALPGIAAPLHDRHGRRRPAIHVLR